MSSKMVPFDLELRMESMELEDRQSTDGLRDIFDAVIKLYEEFERFQFFGKNKEEIQSACLQRMRDMQSIYRNHLPYQSVRINFSHLVTQWSYMYVYMLRHIHLVSYALDLTADVGILTDPAAFRSPTVCMIGGGPGSDVLGLAVHLRQHGHIDSLTSGVHVLDKCTDWEMGWKWLHWFLPTTYRETIPNVNYHAFDYKKDYLFPEQQEIVKNANIITMIKSLSPAAVWLKNREHYKYGIGTDGRLQLMVRKWHSVFSILQSMKPGAFLLYIDNHTGPQRKILMDAVVCFEFDKLYDRVLSGQRMPNDVFSRKARDFITMMGYRPCTTAGLNEVILLRKKPNVM